MGVNEELRRWWDSIRSTVPGSVLLMLMRESALTDNLAQQLLLLADNPESQVDIAQRILAIRSDISEKLPMSENQAPLGRAHHNLAEAYRWLSEKTAASENLRRSLDQLQVAQDTRRNLIVDYPNENNTTRDRERRLRDGVYAIRNWF